MSMTSEYQAAREQAALFDLSDRARIELRGKDAIRFLHNLCSNDIVNLPPGRGVEAFLATAKAKAIAYLFVCKARLDADESLWLSGDPGMAEAIYKHLDRYLISEQVEITDRSAESAQFHVAGPAVHAVLQKALGEFTQPKERPKGFIFCTLHNDLLGVPGYDILCAAPWAEEVKQCFLNGGAIPAGAGTYNVLRVEAGTPVHGQEIEDERFIVELDRGERAISYAKGCYLGQEPVVMARDRGHVNRHLRGVRLGAVGLLPKGTKLFRNDAEVGQITSAVESPRFGPIALAYLRRGNDAPGTVVEAETASGRQSVEVTALPFGGAS